MQNFMHKKFIYFERMRNFVKNWFRIDTKMMRNLMLKSHFVQNHETVAQEDCFVETLIHIDLKLFS